MTYIEIQELRRAHCPVTVRKEVSDGEVGAEHCSKADYSEHESGGIIRQQCGGGWRVVRKIIRSN